MKVKEVVKLNDIALKVTGLAKHFGGIKAVDGIDFEVKSGQFVGLIGPNGCGKSTTFNTISGLLEKSSGEVEVFGKSTEDLKPHQIHSLGLTRTFQHTRLWKDMTVIENLLIPPRNQVGANPITAIMNTIQPEHEKERLEKAWDILETLEITHIAHLLAGELSGGQSKLVDIGRALMGEPRLLLLDEPVAGVAGPLANSIFSHLRKLVDETGISILIIEHNMNFILRQGVDHVIVMNEGTILMSGTPSQVRENDEVVQAYLGGAGVDHDLPENELGEVAEESIRTKREFEMGRGIAGALLLALSMWIPNLGWITTAGILTGTSEFISVLGDHMFVANIEDLWAGLHMTFLLLYALSQPVILYSICRSIYLKRSLDDDAENLILMSSILILSGILLRMFNDASANEIPFGAIVTLLAGVVMYFDIPKKFIGGEEE